MPRVLELDISCQPLNTAHASRRPYSPLGSASDSRTWWTRRPNSSRASRRVVTTGEERQDVRLAVAKVARLDLRILLDRVQADEAQHVLRDLAE